MDICTERVVGIFVSRVDAKKGLKRQQVRMTGKTRKKMSFKIGDVITVKILKIDRPTTGATRIIGSILAVKGTKVKVLLLYIKAYNIIRFATVFSMQSTVVQVPK